MTMRLAREAYKQMISEDVAWLMACQPSLERDHILAILQCSESREYDRPPAPVAPGSFTAEPVAWMWNDELGIPHASAGSKKPVWLESSASAEYIKQANLRPLYAAPTAPVSDTLKDHEIAALVNELRDTAIKYRDAQQLRERIASLIVPALRGVRSPAPVAEIREPWKLPEVTREMCERVAASFYGVATFANSVDMNEALQLWRKELGPALGLVEIREPSDEQCERILDIWVRGSGENVGAGRAMFNAVREVMWPKEGL